MKALLPLIFLSFSLFAQENLEQIEVSHHQEDQHVGQATSTSKVLHEKELKKRREISLGDTLRNEAGVASSSFGPNASRPVIRGLEGDRIRILQNGLGVLDASSQSVDHTVPVDTLIVDSIEVVRGPMSLLYGSQALGGVVNLTTNRIHSQFQEGIVREIQVQGDSAYDGGTVAGKVDYGRNGWMFHFDGSLRNANDQDIPGYARSKKERQLRPSDDEAKDELPNSSSVQKTGAVGVTKVFSKGHLGVSYYRFDNRYGTVAEEDVKIKMIQNRLELSGEYRPEGELIKAIRLRSAQSDYSHKELEGSEVGTTFSNEGNESRLEFLTQAGKLKGTSGVQSQIFNFGAVGEEAYLPPTQNNILSLFTLQEYVRLENTISAGMRFESTHIENEGEEASEKNFRGMSASLGYLKKLSSGFDGIINLSYTERAPNFQELFANGAHLATGTFELGNGDLNKEKAYALDLGVSYKKNQDSFRVNFFTQRFQDYITLNNTGDFDAESELPELRYDQVRAIFYGAELESRHQLGRSPWAILTRADFVRGKNQDTGDNLPRISPPRFTLGGEYTFKNWTWDVEAQYNFEQSDVAPNERRTEAFTLLNTGLIYEYMKDASRLSLFIRLKNLLNEEARLHTSTLKEIAPIPGRNVVGGVQYLF